MPGTAADVVAYDALHQPLSPLFLDYLAGRAGASPFLGPGGFDLAAVAAAAERSAGLERPMAAVAEALARQQEARGAPRAARARAGPGRAGGDGDRHGPAGRALRRAALRPVEGPGHDPGGAAARGSSAGEPSCPCSGWPRTTTTSRRSARRASSTRAGRSAPCATPRATSPSDGRPGRSRSTTRSAALVEELGQALPPALGRDETLGVVAECYRAGRDALGGVRAPRLPPAARAGGARPERRGAQAPDGPGDGARASRGLAHLAPRPRGRPRAPRRGLPPAGAGAPRAS